MSSKVLRSRSKANDSDVVDTESPAKKQRTINNSQKGGDYDPDFAKDDGIDASIDGAEDKNTGKSSRSEAGKKAAETRRRNAANKSNHAQDDKQSDEDDRSNNQSEKHTQGGTHEQHVEAGKKGAEARWGNHDDSSDQSKHVQGGTHEQHVEAGKKGAEARRGRHDDSSDSNQHQSNDQSNQSTKHTQGGTHEQHVEAGKKGAEARWGKHDDSSDSNQHESKHVQGGTHEQHVEAGKKGAETRRGKHGDSSSDSKGKDEAKKITDELSKDKKIQQLKDKQNAERDNEIKECEQLISQAMKQSSKPDLALMLKPEGKNLIQVIRMEHRLVEQLGEKLTSLLKQSSDKAIKTAALGMAFNIMKLLSIHAACEEMVLYPMLKSKGHDALVKHALHEHTEMKRDLVELNEIFNDPNDIFDNPDRKDFITKLRKCLDDTLHHVEEEEESLLPLVESLNSKAELAEMLDQFLKGHEKSPSRPHVDAPAEPPANIKANAEAAQLDMMMDIDEGRFDVPSK